MGKLVVDRAKAKIMQAVSDLTGDEQPKREGEGNERLRALSVMRALCSGIVHRGTQHAEWQVPAWRSRRVTSSAPTTSHYRYSLWNQLAPSPALPAARVR